MTTAAITIKVASPGTGNDGTCENMESGDLTDAQVGKGKILDGNNERINCGSDISLKMTGSFTWSAWVYQNAWPTSGGDGRFDNYIAKGYDPITDGEQQMRLFYDKQLQVGTYQDDPEIGIDASWTVDWNLSEWHLIHGRFDGSTWKIYSDGVEKGSTTSSQTPFPADVELYLGAGDNSGTVDRHLNGRLDEVRVSATDRSAQWILAEYNNQNAPGTHVTEGTPGDVVTGGETLTINVADSFITTQALD